MLARSAQHKRANGDRQCHDHKEPGGRPKQQSCAHGLRFLQQRKASVRIALRHRLGMEHRKPKAVSRKLDPEKQAAFIKAYNDLLNHMGDDEAVLFGDAVHPTRAVRRFDQLG
jgi:hypothetical protein